MLVTSRETRRWVIPKGNVDYKMPPHVAAASEAEEEAGVRGKIAATPFGRYRYQKRMASGASVSAKVLVFALAVKEELDQYKEIAERERRWFSPAEAAEAVDEPDLGKLIRAFAARQARRARSS